MAADQPDDRFANSDNFAHFLRAVKASSVPLNTEGKIWGASRPAKTYDGPGWKEIEDMAHRGDHLRSGVYESWQKAAIDAIGKMVKDGQALHVSSKPPTNWANFTTPNGQRISVSLDAGSLGHKVFI